MNLSTGRIVGLVLLRSLRPKVPTPAVHRTVAEVARNIDLETPLVALPKIGPAHVARFAESASN